MHAADGLDTTRPLPLDEDAEDHLAPGRQPTRFIPRPSTAVHGRVLWPYALAVVGFHLLLPLALVPWLFSWTGLLLIPVGNYVFCSLGIGACYHRLLTHRSYRCPQWFEHTLAVLGVCSLQDSPARWVMVHRLHHQHADRADDPHSPLAGWFWGHVGWVLVENRQLSALATYDRYARDVLRDRFYLWLERGHRWVWVYLAHVALFSLAGFGAGFALTGELLGGVQLGLSLMLYGVVFRTLYSWHVTWGVNSLAHLWGYRSYETDENSRNNWLFALATNGDGWHNNHHADPRSAAHGFHRWWELDITYLTIRLWQFLGLARDVIPPRRQQASSGLNRTVLDGEGSGGRSATDPLTAPSQGLPWRA